LPQALAVVRQLLFQKESPIGILIAINSRVRDLIVYREALDNGWLSAGRGYRGKPQLAWGDVPPQIEAVFAEQFTRDPRQGHPFRIGLLAEQARNFSPARLARCQAAVLEAHTTLVSTGAPARLVLELLLVRMLKRGRRPVASSG
jgi:hypothetical protein